MDTPARLPGGNFIFFEKLASLLKLDGQNATILPCMHLDIKTIRMSFISKVTRLDKGMIVPNDTSLCGAILVLFLEGPPGLWADIEGP